MASESKMLVTESEQLLSRCRALSQKLATYSNRLIGESDALAAEIKSLKASLDSMTKSAKGLQDKETRGTVLEQLQTVRETMEGLGPGGDLRRFCQPKNPALLRLLLGSKTNVVTWRRDQSVAMKEEYHAFRDRAAWIMFCAPALLVIGLNRADQIRQSYAPYTFTPPLLTGFQVYLVWLAYFYAAMAVRENVLLVNGSHIRTWWIKHHYWSAAAVLLVLSLPVDSPTVYRFCEKFLKWSVFQGLVMLVQNRYQRRRMYTRIALGKNSAMDVVGGESTAVSGQLLLLYPLLFVLQLWQLAIGAEVAIATLPAMQQFEGWLDPETSGSDLRGRRGIFVTGCVFAFLALRNMHNTIATLLVKRKGGSGRKQG